MGTKLTGKPATTSFLGTDIFPLVTDPAGTPESKRITGTNLVAGIAALGALTNESFVEAEIEAAITALQGGLAGGVMYQGTWNASTNTPTIPSAAAGNKGHYYKVTTAGSTNIGGITDWQVGDVIVSNGASWDKWDHTTPAASTSAAGIVELATADELRNGSSASLVPSVQTLKTFQPYVEPHLQFCVIDAIVSVNPIDEFGDGGQADFLFTGDDGTTTYNAGLSRRPNGNAVLKVNGVVVAEGSIGPTYGTLEGEYAAGNVNCSYDGDQFYVTFDNPPANGHDVVVQYTHSLNFGTFDISLRASGSVELSEEIAVIAWLQDAEGNYYDLKTENLIEVVATDDSEGGTDPFIVVSYAKLGEATRSMLLRIDPNQESAAIGVINHGGGGLKIVYLYLLLPSGRILVSQVPLDLPGPPA